MSNNLKMDNEDICKLLIRFINNFVITQDELNNERHAATQVVQVTSASSTLFIALLKEICERLQKNKIIKDLVHTTIQDRYCKLIIDNPRELVAINQLINQFKILCDAITTDEIVQNPSISVSTARYKSDFEEIKFIASGSFGSVYRVRHHLDEHEYAIKKICVTLEESYKILKILEEVKTLAKLNHRNVISYRNAWIERGFSSENKPNVPDIEEESPESSKSTQNLKSKLSCSLEELKSISFSDFNIPGCSNNGNLNVNINVASDSDSDNSNSTSSNNNTCVNNDEDDQHLKPSVIDSASKCNSVESIDSWISFRGDADSNNDNGYCEDNNSNQNSGSSMPTSESDIEEIDSDDDDKIVEDHSGVIHQICEYKPRPDVLTLYIQMALCDQTLRKWLTARNNEISSMSTINDIYKQILKGLQYIHSRGIVHHDIKPCNIFISTSKRLQIQIGDFGLACLVRKVDGHKPVGTEMYAAPEQLNGSCDPKSDLYSLGRILLELIYPTTTVMEFNIALKSLQQGEIPDVLEEKYKKYGEIIIKLLIADPEKRPSADQLLEEFEKNKDFIIDRLESEIENKNNDIKLLTDMNLALLNLLKENKKTVRLKRLVNNVRDKNLREK